jgi:hypothetical protein
MDYRLVKQFSNNAIDNFFNFFYKVADFAFVIVDLFWAFVDIWYQFFMIFINCWLYLYYFTLFAIDKLTMSQFIFKRGSARHALPGLAVYKNRVVLPVHPMYGRVDASKPAQAVAQAVQSAASASARNVKSVMKKNVAKDTGESVALLYTRVARSLSNFFKAIGEFFAGKLRPVRDETPEKKKSLIDDYMREYERKKKS